MDTTPSSTTSWNSSGFLPYGNGGYNGLSGKDAAFLASDFSGVAHRDITEFIHRNSKEDALQTLQSKYDISNFQKDTMIQLERLQREGDLAMQALRVELLGEIRSGNEITRALFADRERRDMEKEIAALNAQIAKLQTPVVPAP